MTSRFLRFIPFILKWETEFNKDGSVRVERDPDDPGGTTKYGIDARAHPHVDIPNLTKEGAVAIYYDEWQESGSEKMAPSLGEVYFNARVNCGVGRAQKLLKASKRSPSKFLDEQAAFYDRLVAARPASKKFLKGWLNRVNDLRKFLGVE